MGDISLLTITDDREFLELKDDWNRLLGESPDQNLFLTWEWQYNWWKHFRHGRDLNIVVARQNQRITAILPLLRDGAGFGGLKVHQLHNTSDNIGDYGGFILGLNGGSTAEDIAEYLASEAVKARTVVTISRVPEDSMSFDLLNDKWPALFNRRGVEIQQLSTYVCPYLEVGQHDLKLPRSMRPIYNKLHKDYKIDFQYHQDQSVSASMDILHELHQKRWEDRKAEFQGSFADAEKTAFLHDVVESLNPQGCVRFSVLTADDVPIAGVLGFEFGGRYYYFRPAFDPAYSKYSPGQVLIFYLLNEISSRGITEFDFLRGEDSYKMRWATNMRKVSSVMILKSGGVSKTYWPIFRGLRKIGLSAQKEN